jgi:hypothetical protein
MSDESTPDTVGPDHVRYRFAPAEMKIKAMNPRTLAWTLHRPARPYGDAQDMMLEWRRLTGADVTPEDRHVCSRAFAGDWGDDADGGEEEDGGEAQPPDGGTPAAGGAAAAFAAALRPCACRGGGGECMNPDSNLAGTECCGCADPVPPGRAAGAADAGGEAQPPEGGTPTAGRAAGGAMAVPPEMLHAHPDAAAFGAARRAEDEEEDRAALAADVAAAGVLVPLSVIPRAAGGWWVVDGCGRLAAARAAGLASVPCVPAPGVGEAGVREFATRANTSRRRLTTGERVMRYVDLHRAECAAAWDDGQDKAACAAKNAENPSKKAESRDSAFSASAVSARLGCSRKDAAAGILLAVCAARGGLPAKDARTRATAVVPFSPEELRRGADRRLEALYRDVMGGAVPVRRWLPAFRGWVSTAGAGRAPTDYAGLAERAAASLCTVFEHWTEAEWARGQRERAEGRIAAALALLPEGLRAAMAGLVLQSWPPHEARALAKSITAGR